MTSCCTMLWLEATHACMVSKLATSTFRLIIAPLAQIEVPTHWLAFCCLHFQAFQLIRNLCRLTIALSLLLERLTFCWTRGIGLTLCTLQWRVGTGSLHARQCNQMHIDPRVMHQSGKNFIQRGRFPLVSHQTSSELRRHQRKNFTVCSEDLRKVQTGSIRGFLYQ